TGTGGTQTLAVSGSGRYVRMLGTARATGYGYSLWEMQVDGDWLPSTSTCGTTDIALARPASASSSENGGLLPSAAVDGNGATRWASAWGEPQWLQVDLGARRSVCRVIMHWETAYARTIQLSTSPDGRTWTPATTLTNGWGATQLADVTATGRYLRLTMSDRTTTYGVSLWGLEVFASDGAGPTPLTPVGTPTSTGVGVAPQHTTVAVPADGSLTLLTAGGTPATAVSVAGQGTYTLSGSTVTFAPLFGYAGAATPVRLLLTDTWDQDSTGTYTPTVTPPAPPAAPALSSTGIGVDAQHAVVAIPVGGSVALRTSGGSAATAVSVDHEGVYTLDPSTGQIGFAPTLGFEGIADGADVTLTDAYGQTVTGRYRPVVAAPAGPVAVPLASTGRPGTVQAATVTLVIPAEGSATLVTITGDMRTSVAVPDQGTYLLDTDTGRLAFDPDAGFAGQAQPVTYLVTDAYGQWASATYTAYVRAGSSDGRLASTGADAWPLVGLATGLIVAGAGAVAVGRRRLAARTL
ncbi:MAG: hypothetical protein HGA44_22090, partial [Cellulomonadaceae bacterium]|nr:hypothetical protein [Cellulomonadaceae bacterium]